MANLATLRAAFPTVRNSLDGWHARCPCHEDQGASLSIYPRRYSKTLVYCPVGCSTENVVAAVGLTTEDLFPGQRNPGSFIVQTYDYHDETGKLLYQAVGYERGPLRFIRSRGEGVWSWDLSGVRQVLSAFRAVGCFQSPDFGARCAVNKEEAIEVSHEVHIRSLVPA